MNILLTVIKYLCLLFAIVYGYGNLVRGIGIICGRQQKISGFQMFTMAATIVGYILLEFHLGY